MNETIIKKAISVGVVLVGILLLPNHFHSFDTFKSTLLTLCSAIVIAFGIDRWNRW